MRVQELLKKAGLKTTPVRIKVIQMLQISKKLLSAQDIYLELQEEESQYSLSTIYRTIEKLVESEIVNAVNLKIENQTLYEYNCHKHHHFLICEKCHTIETVYDCAVHEYEEKVAGQYGFVVNTHKVEFYGTCEKCNEKM